MHDSTTSCIHSNTPKRTAHRYTRCCSGCGRWVDPNILQWESVEADAAVYRPSHMLQLALYAEGADMLQRKLAETRVGLCYTCR